MPARRPVSGHGNPFIGSGTAFRASSKRLRGTISVIWGEGQSEPWIILTDLAPEEAGASWRESSFWIETGFKALKREPSALRLALLTLSRLLAKGRMRRRARLLPEPLPPPPEGVVVYHSEPQNLPM